MMYKYDITYKFPRKVTVPLVTSLGNTEYSKRNEIIITKLKVHVDTTS
jgi:hypothetical protein